jgi:hypothetical protein
MSSSTPKQVDPKWAEQVTPELTAAVEAKAVDGKVTCPVLRKLAEDRACPTRSPAPRPIWPASASTTATSAASRRCRQKGLAA